MAHNRLALLFMLMAVVPAACKSHKAKTYSSECAAGIQYKPVSFVHLIDSIKYYDKQYVQVSGTYQEGKHTSALVNDSTFTDHSNAHAFWVNFTQDCPLYENDNHTGLFETEDGQYNQLNNKAITIRGRIDVQKKGHLKAYRATINEVSYLKLN
ncbi:hypothetical protein FFF34_008615 [Inquilinus sp. KBS0705]|nr:hypothetical protein FFF34_008615 [Inquilinus sp. KBS0705]